MTGPLKKGAAHVTGLPSAPCPLSLTQMPRTEGPLQVSPGAPPSRKAALHPEPSWPQALELSTLELTAGSPWREEATLPVTTQDIRAENGLIQGHEAASGRSDIIRSWFLSLSGVGLGVTGDDSGGRDDFPFLFFLLLSFSLWLLLFRESIFR